MSVLLTLATILVSFDIAIFALICGLRNKNRESEELPGLAFHVILLCLCVVVLVAVPVILS